MLVCAGNLIEFAGSRSTKAKELLRTPARGGQCPSVRPKLSRSAAEGCVGFSATFPKTPKLWSDIPNETYI